LPKSPVTIPKRPVTFVRNTQLLYAKHEGQNYYLTICTHDKTTHATVRQQIEDVCGMEFPFVMDLLVAL
jgi:hypothetical protein